MKKRERLEEEFELEDESQAIDEYSYITSVISINYSLISDELSKLGDFQEGLAVDAGTGLGDLAIEIGKRYPKLNVIGIDISRKAIEAATNKAKNVNLNNVNFRWGDVHSLNFEDNSVDLVVSHGSIHHWKDAPCAFHEIYRILKPNALAYLTDLRRDAPEEIVKKVRVNLSINQAKGFINSIHASYSPEELEDIFKNLNIKGVNISGQKFTRDTILKNMEKLRKSLIRNADYTKLSQTITIKKPLLTQQ